jgi:hypothetical protein
MKGRILMVAVLSILFIATNSFAWCVTEFKKTKSCTEKKSIYMVTDVQTDLFVIGFCLDVDQMVDVVEFFQEESIKPLVGKCHQEGSEWDRAPLIIKIIDQVILTIKKPSGGDPKKAKDKGLKI